MIRSFYSQWKVLNWTAKYGHLKLILPSFGRHELGFISTISVIDNFRWHYCTIFAIQLGCNWITSKSLFHTIIVTSRDERSGPQVSRTFTNSGRTKGRKRSTSPNATKFIDGSLYLFYCRIMQMFISNKTVFSWI